MREKNIDPRVQPLWPETGKQLDMGRDATYAAAARGEIPTVRIGRRLLVPLKQLAELLGEA